MSKQALRGGPPPGLRPQHRAAARLLFLIMIIIAEPFIN